MAQPSAGLTPDVVRDVRAYRRALDRAAIPVVKLIVFGSRAKGTAHGGSDIDVAVVSPEFGRNRLEEGILLMRYRGDLVRIEPHPFHPSDLDNRWSTLAQEIRRYGTLIE